LRILHGRTLKAAAVPAHLKQSLGFSGHFHWHRMCARLSFTRPSGRRYRGEARDAGGGERLSLLEVKMQDVSSTLVRMEGVLASVHQMVVALEQRVIALDLRVDKLDQRVDRLEQRVDKLDHRIDRLDQRIDKLDDRVVKSFVWLVGIQITILITIVAGLFGIVTKLI
jgi:chaperonin cofactor prefoldin